MSASRVPWHRSLFVRLFAIGALIAVVAVVAATWATVRSTAVAVRQEQQQSLREDAATYDALVGYAATHASWAGAAGLVERLARDSGDRVSVTDPAGRPLLDSDGETEPRDPSEARATLDPLDVEVPLLSVAPSEAAPETGPRDQPAATPCGDPLGCVRRLVTGAATMDPRVLQLGDDRVLEATKQFEVRLFRCFARRGLEQPLSVTFPLQVAVSFRGHDAAVVRCVEAGRRAALADDVAPPALLFVDGGDPSAEVFFDLSSRSQVQIALLAGGVLAVTLLLCALLAASVSRPLRRMATAARLTSDGDLGVRVPDGRRDEVGEVARAFNEMADRREQLEDARRRVASDVSHELRTPLANVRGWLEAVQDGVAEPDGRLIDSLHEETLHLQRLVDDLHQLALGDAGELRLDPEPLDLAGFLGQLADGFRGAADTAGVVLEVDVEPGATVRADRLRLRQAVANLVANALRHTARGGRVVLAGAPDTIRVVDDGEGIAADELPHVFDRFHRVDASRSRATGGSGLGLAIVRQIAEAHGGDVRIASEPGAGTTVTLTTS